MSTRRVIKILNENYERGLRDGLKSSIPPNSGHFAEGIWARLNKQISWAYQAGWRDGERERLNLVGRAS